MVRERPDLKQYEGRELTVIAWLWARTVRSPNPAFADVEVPLDSDVGVEVELERISGGLRAVGEVAARWSGPCARCWLPVDGQVRAEVSEVFTAEPREGEQYALGLEYADLVPMVREAVLLDLPIEAIRCPHPEPCPNLPAELAAPSEGDAQPADPRWAALEALRTQPGQPSRAQPP